jgi:signal peptidase
VRLLRLTGLLCICAALLAQVGLAVAMMVAHHTGHQFLIITGGSMEPTYELGSALLLEDLRPEDVGVGDAVTYTSVEGTLTTHRVISLHTVDGHRYARTQGDANQDPDPNFTPVDSVIGRPVLHVPHGGHVAALLLSPLGRLLAYGPPLLVMLLVEVRLIRAHLGAHRRVAVPTGRQDAATPGDTSDSPRTRKPVRSNPSLVPLVLAVLVGSLAVGTFVERSTALFTSLRTTNANAVSTATLAPPTGLTATKIGSVIGGGTQSYTDSSLALGTFHYVLRTRAHTWSSTSSNQASARVVGML